METKTQARHNDLDWLRVLGILLVFIYHTTRIYNVESWVVKNNIWYPAVEVWNKSVTSFMMPLMFAISGASLFYALGKGGFGLFLKDKALRLLVPLLVADLTHISIQAYLESRTLGLFGGSYLQFLPYYYHLDTIQWQGQHLWYLKYLFIFSLALYPLLRWLKGNGRGALARLSGWLRRPAVLYLAALPLLLVYLLPEGFPLRGENGGYPYLTYMIIILLGFAIAADGGLQERIRKLRWISLAAGLALLVGFNLVYLQIANPDEMSPALFLAGLQRTLGGWLLLLAILGLGRQHLTNRPSWLRYANEAVLPFYIFHQTVIVAVGYFVLRWGLPDPLEWAVVALLSFTLIMTLYETLVRHWNPMRFLFGMKPLRPQPTAASVRPQLGGAARVE